MQAVIAKFGHKIDFKQDLFQALNKLMEENGKRTKSY
jgi:hypothetical protein